MKAYLLIILAFITSIIAAMGKIFSLGRESQLRKQQKKSIDNLKHRLKIEQQTAKKDDKYLRQKLRLWKDNEENSDK